MKISIWKIFVDCIIPSFAFALAIVGVYFLILKREERINDVAKSNNSRKDTK